METVYGSNKNRIFIDAAPKMKFSIKISTVTITKLARSR